MALSLKTFHCKLPEGLLEISERVFVFNCCLTSNISDINEYRACIGHIVDQLHEHFPDSPIMVHNFVNENHQTQISNTLSEYGVTVINHHSQNKNFPLLPLDTIHYFLSLSCNWISSGQRNLLLMHRENGCLPVCFMIAAYLIYSKKYTDERKILDVIYKLVSWEHFQLLPVNPLSSQSRYLEYVWRKDTSLEWAPTCRAFRLHGEWSCGPIFRIYGPDPFTAADSMTLNNLRAKVLISEIESTSSLVGLDSSNKDEEDFPTTTCVKIQDTFTNDHSRALEADYDIKTNQSVTVSCITQENPSPRSGTAGKFENFVLQNEVQLSMHTPQTVQKHEISRASSDLGNKDGLFLKVSPKHGPENNTSAQAALTGTQRTSFKSCENMDSMSKKIESNEQHVFVHRSAQSKIVLPQVSQISPKLSPSPLSRYRGTASSALGITALLHDHAEFTNKQVHCLSTSASVSHQGPVDPTDSFMPQMAEVKPPLDKYHIISRSELKSPPPPPPLPSFLLKPMEPRPLSSVPSPPPPLLPLPFSNVSVIQTLPAGNGPRPLVASSNSSSSTPCQDSSLTLPAKNSTVPPAAPSPPPPPLHPALPPAKNSTTPPAAPSPPPPPLHAALPPAKNSTAPPAAPSTPPPPLHAALPPAKNSTAPPAAPSLPPPPLHAALPPPKNSTAPPAAPSPPPPPSPPLHAALLTAKNSTAPPAAPSPPPPPLHAALMPVKNSTAPPAAPSPPPPPLHAALPPATSQQVVVPPPPATLSKGGPTFLQSGKGKLQPRTSMKTQTQVQPRKAPLRPYHWLKLTRAMQGSLWAEVQKPEEASKVLELDISELESLFSTTITNSDNGGTAGKTYRRGSGLKPDKTHLIELRRAYNCEIMLTKVKVPLSDLMNSVLALDDSALDVDQVDNLIKFCPTKEEIELLKNYNGERESLGKCEQFFLELMKVPCVESKLRVFSFKIQFFSQLSDLRNSLNIVNSASQEVRNSVKLKRIMQSILSLGNALNQGTARGSAVGFRLDSLLKLGETRSKNNKLTLIHYLCKVLAEKMPEVLDFHEDLASLEAAAKIQLKYLAEEMQALSKGLEKVSQELNASEKDGAVSEHFCKTLKEFYDLAEAEVRGLASIYCVVGKNADALALYFGEDPARCPFEQVVSTILSFLRMFRRAHDENCKQKELEKKKKKKKAQEDAENEKSKLNVSRKEMEMSL